MRTILFVASTLAVALATSPESRFNDYPHIDNFDDAKQCIPNKGFYNQCNYCQCSADGVSAACTRMECSYYHAVRIDNYVTGQKCPAGKSFVDKCNDCRCTDSGLSAACTRKACPEYDELPNFRSCRSVEPNYPHIDNFDEAGECVPNRHFYNKCNTCKCTPDGKSAACTMMLCYQDTIRIDNYVQGMKCPAGKSFYDKCNKCQCGPNGLSAACTRKACPEFDDIRAKRSVEDEEENLPHIDNFDDAKECIPNKRFYNKCNGCTCSDDGKSAACTRKACPETDIIRIDDYVHGQKCPAGRSFQDRCNTCHCSNNGLSALCTLIACLD